MNRDDMYSRWTSHWDLSGVPDMLRDCRRPARAQSRGNTNHADRSTRQDRCPLFREICSNSRVALDVPKRIADILKIEFHTALLQACPFAAPIPEEVTVRTLTRLLTVRTGERF